MASAGTVTLELDANSVKLIRELQKAQKQTGKSAKGMQGSMTKSLAEIRKGIDRTVKAIGAIGVAAAASGAMIFRNTSAAAREIRILSDTANTSAEEFQRMAHGADFFGISQEKLSDILKDTTDRVGDFMQTGGGPMADFFENIAPKVGVTAEQFARLSGKDALQLYVSSLEAANLSQADMVFYMEAIASDSTRLLPLLSDNGAAMKEFADETDALGFALSDIDIKMIEEANREIDKARKVFRGVANEFTTQVAPAIGLLSERIVEASKETNDFEGVFLTSLENISIGIAYVGNAIKGWQMIIAGLRVVFSRSIQAILITFRTLGTAIETLLLTMQVFSSTATTAILKVARGALNGIEDMVNGVITRINALILLANKLPGVKFDPLAGASFETLDRFDKVVADAEGTAEHFRNKLADLFSDPANNGDVAGFFKPIIDGVDATADHFTEEFKAAANSELPTDAIEKFFNDVRTNVSNVVVEQIEKVSHVVDGAKNKIIDIEALTQSAAKNMQSSFADFLFDPFKDGIKGMLKGFVDMIRRMIAEAAAAQILKQLFGGLAGSSNSFLSGIGEAFGGTVPAADVPGVRDVGGRGEAGKPYIINPKAGPELFIPKTAGEFVPNIDEMGGGTSLSLTIDARDAGAEARIKNMIVREMVPQIISAATQDTIRKLRRPRFA